MNRGIYVHIPFCAKKCPYCDFYSLNASDEIKDDYAKAVIKSFSLYKKGIKIDTVYFGGGTPYLMGEKRLGKILTAIKKHFSLTSDAEITLEANPAGIDLNELISLRESGFNRISFGVQSANVHELKILKRAHTSSDVENAVFLARKAGFNNISADIMLGTPCQTVSDVKQTLNFLISLNLEHISAYMLKIEKNTAFNSKNIISMLPSDDTVSDIYLMLCDTLNKNGYLQYEISNFAKRGFESRHNLKYWRCEEYIGFGPSAHSFFEGKRFYYERDVKDYIKSLGENIVFDEEVNTLCEYIMLGLRLSEGITLKKLKSLGADIEGILKKCKVFIDNGFMIKSGDTLALTAKGFLVSNTVIASLI